MEQKKRYTGRGRDYTEMNKMEKVPRIITRHSWILAITILMMLTGCSPANASPQPPVEIPKGILVERIPEEAEILFVSMRYVLDDPDCLDEKYSVKKNYINDPACNAKIYNPEADALASPRQVYSLDRETGQATLLTNLECDFSSIKPVDSERIMAIGMCSDTDGDGTINTRDKPEIHLINLPGKNVDCLTCGLDLRAINNPDYSQSNQKILFSAQWVDKFHNYLFTLDLHQNLIQITNSEEYMDFDCSWSEDGNKIVFNRLPDPFFSQPSQVWLMDADGSSLEKITEGGGNPDNEEPHGPYPIGLDADPDLIPDNSQIVFSRLWTGKLNEPFGVYELALVDVGSKEITILDASYANMVPEWKEGGIIFIRQIGSASNGMEIKQSIYLYQDNKFTNLEPDFDIFPIGSNGASWTK